MRLLATARRRITVPSPSRLRRRRPLRRGWRRRPAHRAMARVGVLALVAAVVVDSAPAGRRPCAGLGRPRPVAVARRDLRPATPLATGDVDVRELPVGAVPAPALAADAGRAAP